MDEFVYPDWIAVKGEYGWSIREDCVGGRDVVTGLTKYQAHWIVEKHRAAVAGVRDDEKEFWNSD